MAFSQKILPHYTYTDYQHWEGKWELIDGFPIAMSPAPVPKHQRVAASLITAFGSVIKGCDTCTVYGPIDYKIADDIILQPDMVIVCADIEKNYLDFPPALVVEILSPSTALRDRHTKYDLYQEQQIKYYLIVDPEKKAIEVYELINKVYTLIDALNDTYRFTLAEGCEVAINGSDIW